MSVRNGEKFLAEAIESVLSQTWRDFECIIINDGSIDGTAGILAEFAEADPRITVVEHAGGAGLAVRLNQGLELARGALIARMDADDIALPERFSLQKDFLDAHPEVAAVGGSVAYIDDLGAITGEYVYPCAAEAIREQLLYYGSPIAHPAAMFRLKPVRAIGGYRSIFPYAQDYDLWLRLAEKGGLANLAERILHYRIHAGSTNKQHTTPQLACMALARLSARQRVLLPDDILAKRQTPVDVSLARQHMRNFDMVTLGQLISTVSVYGADAAVDSFVEECWKTLLRMVPVTDREQRALAVAYGHALACCPGIIPLLCREWEASPCESLHREILAKLILTLPLPPFDKLEKALSGHSVADHLLARELVWRCGLGADAPAWLGAILGQELAALHGPEQSDYDWLSARYGCLSLLIRQGLAGWLGAMAPQADIRQAGPTASLALLCRLCVTVHASMDGAPETVVAALGQWLLTEAKNPHGRDMGLLRCLARLGDSADFALAAKLFAECTPEDEQGISVIVTAEAGTNWLFYLSNVISHTANVELVLCDLSPNFAVHFFEHAYAHRHSVTVFASSKGLFAPKNEALTACRYPIIAFAKDFYCYDLHALSLASGHLQRAEAVWGQPHFAERVPDVVRHELAFDVTPEGVEEYFPLFIRRGAIDRLGFFNNDSNEQTIEKEYRVRMRTRGVSTAYAEDVLVPHGRTPSPPAARYLLSKAKSLARHGLRFRKKSPLPKDSACAPPAAPVSVAASSLKVLPETARYMPSLDDFRFAAFEEWLQLFPGRSAPLFVSPGVDLALRRARGRKNKDYSVLPPSGLLPEDKKLLLALFAQEAKKWPRELLAAHCTVLLYDDQPEDAYAVRSIAYDAADLCVALTEESQARLAMLHPLVCRADSVLVALAWAHKLYLAARLGTRYPAPAPYTHTEDGAEAALPRKPFIMLLVDTFYTGGRENVILALMPYLRDKGCKVALGITRDSTPEGRAMLEQAGLEFFNFSGDAATQQKILLERKIDLVVAQHCRDGVLAAGLAGIPCVQSIYGMFMQAEKAELDEWKRLDACTSTYSCVSALAAMCVDRYFGVDVHKIVIAPCASSMRIPTGFGQRGEDPALRAELGIPQNSPVFIYPARLQDAKGQRLLLDAFAQAFQQDPRIRLVLLGPCFDYGYKARLQGLIANYGLDHAVILAGHRDDLPRFFNLGKALVMPSFTEGWSLSIAEAVQAGLPVIATDVGGATEQLRGTDGILLPAFADDLWRMTPARMQYAIHHEHQHHQLREALCQAFLAMASRPSGSQSPPQATSVVSIEEACARQLHIFLATLGGHSGSALRNGTFIPQKQSKYIDVSSRRKESRKEL
jgi:glycosyltransferase involved in cell wall biosynthesis